MASPPWLDAAASYATCQTLTSAGGALVGTGVATMAAGGSGLVPLSLGMLSLLGAGAVCQPTPVDVADPYPAVDGCQRVSDGGYGTLQWKEDSFKEWVDFSQQTNFTDVTEIVKTEVIGPGQDGKWISFIEWKRFNGTLSSTTDARKDTINAATRIQWRIRVTNGTCAATGNDPKPYPPDFNNPIPYTDPTTQCTYNITPQGFVTESEGGGAGFVMKIEAATSSTRASGGVVGGCNFSPTLVYQPPGGGPPTTIPWDPDWPDWDGGGTPPWITALIGGVGGATVTFITSYLETLFETKYPPGTREIYAACNYKQDGSPETFSVTFPEENYQNRVLTSLDAIVDFQQQILLWKTPTCSGGGVGIAGDPVTVNFVSDEYSLDGNNVLRKRFVYFDQTGAPLEDHVTHWKDFTWEAGPACVSFEGTPMGKPQVWASTVDEAKRVITHAAAIAGVAIADGQWMTGTSRSSRYGKPGTMRVARFTNGNYTVTKRSGPSGNPEAVS